MKDEKKLIWTKKSQKTLCETPVFSVTQIESESPEGKKGNFIVMDAPEWGIIVPVLAKPEGDFFVMVKQWRHGSNSLSIEFPGGVMNGGENPEKGAARELAEETGFTAGKVTHLASLSPNPAIMSNRVHIFAAENLTDTKKLHLDDDEFVETLLIPAREVYDHMGNEPYTHSLMSTALFLYRRYREKQQ